MRKPTVALSDLSPDAQKRVMERMAKDDQTVPRKTRERRAMPIDQVRAKAIEVLAVLTDLSQKERERVLRHAIRVNWV